MQYKGTFEGLKEIVRKAGCEIIEPKSIKDVPYGLVHHIEIAEGGIILWHEVTQNICIQNAPAMKERLKKELAKYTEKSTPPSLKVFIVHGHDHTALEQLELILHKLKLEPYVLQNTSGNGSTIIEALEKEICTPTRSIKFGIVLLTPDDMGYAKSDGETAAKPRARQNVILEMGMLMSALSRKNVAILIKENQNIEKPSDMSGIMYIPFKNHVRETVPKLTDRLINSGFTLDPKAIAYAFS
ncbi:hypothetical protein MEI_00888 [Bartonella vinsonii subsp. arupensis Pm136co]|uniref:CD-NTase-associated protein 12/Pycsar effector protein TIR domain-containing protein n=1 Tax=Bartonella vinsonii subsp. arupensis Pm136co TaxID=1094561 RepID=A0ABN0GQ24_BARVI|nr:nucleotide-binding protein [Bartonella vinsonii]EJF98389.1 hypothetical protein MEI_00888 [Bartonella vinsonii subsp. arupensis Pm136co]